MSQLNKISVIIPTYNRSLSVKRTLSLLLKSDVLPDEILVVDQSTDKEVATDIKSFCDENQEVVKYIWYSTPSLTASRNIGIETARNDILLFMDDDVDVSPDTLSKIQSTFSDKNISMLGVLDKKRVGLSNTRIFGLLFGKTSFFKKKKGYVLPSVFSRYPVSFNGIVETEWAMGYCFAVRKSLLQKWNIRFDENLKFYAYAEDLDFSYSYYKNAIKESKKCILDSNIAVLHNESKEYRTPSKSVTFMKLIHRYYINRKHFNSACSLLVFIWENVGEMIYSVCYAKNLKDFLKAVCFCIKYRKDIKNGNFHYDEFMELK